MMLRLSRQTVRRSWPPYAGAFVALACGTVLVGTAVNLAAAVDAAINASDLSADQRTQLADLSSLVGVMAGISVFMALFVVGSTFGFVVASRRRELGMLRLIGATPWQVRRMVLGESALVAVLAGAAGCLLSAPATTVFVWALRARGLLDVALEPSAPWLPWAVAGPVAIGVALLGSWRSSARAARVAPAAALREAGVGRRPPSVVAITIGSVCLGAPIALMAVADHFTPLFTVVVSILVPEVLVIGLVCFGGVLFPWLAGLLGRPFVDRDVTARLAREQVRTAVRMPAALAAPILAISAIAGSLIVALSFTADWTTALDREQLRTPLVVETGGDPAVAERIVAAQGVAVADPRSTISARLRPDGERDLVDVIDLPAATQARGLTAVEGSLARLGADDIVVTETYAFDLGADVGDPIDVRVGGQRIRATVAAVVRDAPDLYGEVLVPRAMVADLPLTVPDVVFVDPGSADLDALLAGTAGRVLAADAWIDSVDQQTRAGNSLGLWVLLGPAGLYAAIAIVNAVLIGASQRRTQVRTAMLLGATDRQLRRTALWEAGLVGGAALVVGGAVTGFVGWLIRQAVTRDVGAVGMTIPWLPLLAILGTCLGLTLVAALVGSRRITRSV
ncbi:FtsX-like permease family protein [Mumia xiangluensis]|uniref:FtsX-like permease family protein n=1 Tax=Mumia xiangluensis TaxID=1678900 RepID=A0ABW1QHN7_9ACTN